MSAYYIINPQCGKRRRVISLTSMRCDTCGKEVKEVSRVVVDEGYDRTLARALYNCPECYAKKEEAKSKARPKPGMGSV